VADNIDNADTTGYKRSSVEFSTCSCRRRRRLQFRGVNNHRASAVTAQGVLVHDLGIDLAINATASYRAGRQRHAGPHPRRRVRSRRQGRLVNAADTSHGIQLRQRRARATANGFEGGAITITDQA